MEVDMELTDEREVVSAAMELIGYDTTSFLFETPSDAESAELATSATVSTVTSWWGTLFCRTRDTILDIFTAAPPPPAPPPPPPPAFPTCLACRLVPALVTLVEMLFETELMIAEALAMPCLARWPPPDPGG